MLARVLAQPSNVLVLDEPTNDLDMDTLDHLFETLDAYDGTLIVVSHDRDFVDKLVTSLIVLDGQGRVQEYVGGYEDYLRQCGADAKGARSASGKKGNGDKAERKRGGVASKLSYKDQRQLDSLPSLISDLETEIEQLNRRLTDADFFTKDADGFTQAAARLEAAKTELNDAEARWLELESLRESFASETG
jgi:ATP-binding cassette subfamily F protein uup